MSNREEKIKRITELLRHRGTLTTIKREELIFDLSEAQKYHKQGDSEGYIYSQILELSDPYKSSSIETPVWEEVKQYDDREEIYYNLPEILVQIDLKKPGEPKPYQIILPAMNYETIR